MLPTICRFDAVSAVASDHIAITGLVLDGGGVALPERRGLLHLAQGRAVHIAECEIVNAGRNGITLEAIEGDVTGNVVSTADIGIFSLDARGLRIAGNTVRGAGNGGILVWRSAPGDDGTLVIDNRIEDVAARAGGSGQYGNAVNIFRAGNVIVRGNRIRNAAFSAVRGNTASNLQIVGNTCTGLGEVALYAEFGFEGALIANNIVDGAALGVSVTNFNQGGRLAVVQGNVIRNLTNKRPPGTDPNDLAGVGIGIGIEADTVVTGNVVENAPNIGIAAGWGAYLRDVAVNANVIRNADFGITVSVAPGAGAAVIDDNLISGVRRGAIVGMEWNKPVTGDLAKDGATPTRNCRPGQAGAVSGDRRLKGAAKARVPLVPLLRGAHLPPLHPDYASASVTRNAPNSMPFQLRSVGCANGASACRSASVSGSRRAISAAATASAARPAPSSHLMAIPRPSVGNAPQATPSAPVLKKIRSPRSRTISVPKRPVPATYQGWCVQAARSRAAARARSDERPRPVANLAKACARLCSGAAQVGTEQPSMARRSGDSTAPVRSCSTPCTSRCTAWSGCQ